MGSEQEPPPATTWAQRKDIIFLTYQLEDCKDPDIRITSSTVHFRGVGGTDKKPHALDIELYGKIDEEKSKISIQDRKIDLILYKLIDADEGYWPRLTKDQKKHHWLKTDFSRWQPEDDSENEVEEDDSFMKNFTNVIDPSYGNSSESKPSFDYEGDSEGESEDSDDKDMPDLE